MSAWEEFKKELEESGDESQKAIVLILEYGSFDGAHHKQWVLDQALRILAGEDGYEDALTAFTADGFEWDQGIVP